MDYKKTLMIDTNIYDLAQVNYALENPPMNFEEYLLVLLTKGRKKNLKERKFFGTYQQVDIDTESDWVLDATTNEINTYLYAELEEYNDKRYTTNRGFKWVTSVLRVLSKRFNIAENWLNKLIENRQSDIVSIRRAVYHKAVLRKHLKEILFLIMWAMFIGVGIKYLSLSDSVQGGVPTRMGLLQLMQVCFGSLFGIETIGYFGAVGIALRISNRVLFKIFKIMILALLVFFAVLLLIGYLSADVEKNSRIAHLIIGSLQVTVAGVTLYILIVGVINKVLRSVIKGVPVISPDDVRNSNVSLYSIDEDELWREIELNGIEISENKVRGVGIERFELTFTRAVRWL